MFEPEVFRKRMYCIEERTCDTLPPLVTPLPRSFRKLVLRCKLGFIGFRIQFIRNQFIRKSLAIKTYKHKLLKWSGYTPFKPSFKTTVEVYISLKTNILSDQG